MVDSIQCRLQTCFGVEVRLEISRVPSHQHFNKSMKSSCNGYYGLDTGFTVPHGLIPAQGNVQVSPHS